MSESFDEKLDRELRRLRGTTASEGFTHRLMHELHERRAARRGRPVRWLPAAVAATVLALLLGIAVTRIEPPADGQPQEAGAGDLKREYRDLLYEYESLRAQVEDSAPVLYLGGTEEVDVVLNLESLIAGPMPASIQRYNDL